MGENGQSINSFLYGACRDSFGQGELASEEAAVVQLLQRVKDFYTEVPHLTFLLDASADELWAAIALEIERYPGDEQPVRVHTSVMRALAFGLQANLQLDDVRTHLGPLVAAGTDMAPTAYVRELPMDYDRRLSSLRLHELAAVLMAFDYEFAHVRLAAPGSPINARKLANGGVDL